MARACWLAAGETAMAAASIRKRALILSTAPPSLSLYKSRTEGLHAPSSRLAGGAVRKERQPKTVGRLRSPVRGCACMCRCALCTVLRLRLRVAAGRNTQRRQPRPCVVAADPVRGATKAKAMARIPNNDPPRRVHTRSCSPVSCLSLLEARTLRCAVQPNLARAT